MLDFGIAKLIEGDSLTTSTQVIGTPLYMAPEQFHGTTKPGPETDVYALGLIAYTLLTGKSYWAEELATLDNRMALAMTMSLGPKESAVARARRVGISLPAPFDAWFRKAANVESTKRYPSASGAILELADALGVPRPKTGSVSHAPLRRSDARAEFEDAATALAPESLRRHALAKQVAIVAAAALATLGAVAAVVWKTSRVEAVREPEPMASSAQLAPAGRSALTAAPEESSAAPVAAASTLAASASVGSATSAPKPPASAKLAGKAAAGAKPSTPAAASAAKAAHDLHAPDR